MFFSYLLIILFFPFSLFYSIKVSPLVISVIACAAVRMFAHAGICKSHCNVIYVDCHRV